MRTLITSLLLALVGISLAVSDGVQTRARLDQRLALQADGEANALGGLFTRTRLALRLLAADSAFHDGIASTGLTPEYRAETPRIAPVPITVGAEPTVERRESFGDEYVRDDYS